MKQRVCIIVFLMFGICTILFVGCAFDLVHIKQIPAQIKSNQPVNNSWKLTHAVKVSCGTGYSRQIKSGTKWDYVGTVEQGDVFKTQDQILTIEGSNMFEVYIVLSGDKLVGFYLPVEKTYSPLHNPQTLQIEVMN